MKSHLKWVVPKWTVISSFIVSIHIFYYTYFAFIDLIHIFNLYIDTSEFLSLLMYRKIPEISPSKYKPPNLVTQKTLR